MHLRNSSFHLILYVCVFQLKDHMVLFRDISNPIIRPWSYIRRHFCVFVLKAIFRKEALVLSSGKTSSIWNVFVYSSAIMEMMVNPLQEQKEEWKNNLIQLDKDHAKG